MSKITKLENLKKITKDVESKRNGKEVRCKAIMKELIGNYDFHTVLDVGSGGVGHPDIFRGLGKEVHTCDMTPQYGPTYLGNFLDIHSEIPDNHYDVIWCSHTLEHQMNPGIFLSLMKKKLKPGGLLALTVPPMKHYIVAGHVNHWTAGMLLLNLVLVGFDCSEAIIKAPKPEKFQGYPSGVKSIEPYDISVLVPKNDINWTQEMVDKMQKEKSDIPLGDTNVHDGMLYLSGAGLQHLKKYFPKYINWVKKGAKDIQFDGRIGDL